MAKTSKEPAVNPLLRKNIPPAPPLGDKGKMAAGDNGRRPLEENGRTTTEENGNTVSEENMRTVTRYNGNTVSENNGNTAERQTVIPLSSSKIEADQEYGEQEKATIELSLYLRPSQDDKLEDLRRAYKKRTKKKISANEVMRRLINQATLDDIL